MKKITSLRQMLLLNSAWIGTSFMWNSLHPLILPAMLLKFVPDAQKNTTLGILLFSGLTIAIFVQPFSGYLSDHWTSRWGRRRPLVLLGILFNFIFLSCIAWAGGLAWLFIGYIGLQLSSNLAQGALQGLMPDRVAPERMGQAAAIKAFMDMASLVAAALLAGRLLDPVTHDASMIIVIVMVVLAIAVTVTLVGTAEEPTHEHPRMKISELLSQFRLDPRENPAYWWLTGERALFLLGVYALQSFAQYYLQDVLQVPNPVKQAGTLLASITVGIIILVLIGGWLTDKFGAKRIILAGSLLSMVGLVLMMLVHDMSTLTVVASIFGAGVGLFMTSNWALANQIAPQGEAGKYLGLTNLATAGAGALARLEGPLIDTLNHAYPGQWLGYMGMFAFGTICVMASMVLLNRVTIKVK